MPELASQIELGASPRATLGLLSAGRAMAMLRGRRFVVPEDIHDVAPEVLRHRILLSYDALANGTGLEDVVGQVLQRVAAPRVAPHQDEMARTSGYDAGRTMADGTPTRAFPAPGAA